NLITAAVAHPGIAGMVIGAGVLSQMGLVRDNIITPLLNFIQTGLGPLIINVVRSVSTALQNFIGNINFIAIPIASKKNNSKDVLKIFEGKNIVIIGIIFGIIIIIGGAVKSNLKPNITFMVLSALVGLVVGIIAGKKGWVRLRKEGMNKQFAEKLEKYENETKKESRKVTTSKELRNIVEWLRMKFARNEHQSATSEVVFGKKVENVENRLQTPQNQEPRQQIQRQLRSQYKTFNQPTQQPQQRQIAPQFQKLMNEAKGNPFPQVRQALPRGQENVNTVNRPTRNINKQINRR
ncbi:MAG: hypothetical protein AABY14_01025, partial [Nanoarchaeota archaeon]